MLCNFAYTVKNKTINLIRLLWTAALKLNRKCKKTPNSPQTLQIIWPFFAVFIGALNWMEKYPYCNVFIAAFSAFLYVSISYFYRNTVFGLSIEKLLVFVFQCSHK